MGFYSDPDGGEELVSPEVMFGDAVSAVGQRAGGEDVVSRTTGKAS